jgi:hypothetical protein
MGIEDPVLLFSCFADCLNVPEYLSMGLLEFFEAVCNIFSYKLLFLIYGNVLDCASGGNSGNKAIR